ncbi:MAG: hypothetical protein IJ083_01535 [Clostridia bacterium]|nr:hypothetical protein [Clostridia bacterium]
MDNGREIPGRHGNRRRFLDCYLNGRSLTEVDERIFLVNVEETPKEECQTASYARFDGQRIMARRRLSLEITLTLMLKEWDPVRRSALMASVYAWAGSFQGVQGLQLSSRPGQVLLGNMTALPVTEYQNWARTMQLKFTSSYLPFFQGEEAEASDLGDGTYAISPGGNAEWCYLGGEIRNIGDTAVNTVQVETMEGGETLSLMRFEGLGLAPGSVLRISYTPEQFLRLQKGGVSCMGARTATSSDDLIVPCGRESRIRVTGASGLVCTFSARGLYR